MWNTICSALLLVISSSVALSQAPCQLRTQESGICKPIIECASAIRDLSSGLYPVVCDFEQNHVCCEQSAKTALPELETTTPATADFDLKVAESTSCFAGKYMNFTAEDEAEFGYEMGDSADLRRNRANVINFLAKIGVRNSNGDEHFFCGGVLLTTNFVLCPAHCTNYHNKSPEIVQLGTSNAYGNTAQDTMEKVPIVKIHVHPNYSSNAMYDDIALLELAVPTSYLPACVWRWDEDHIQDNNTIYALGHDLQNNGHLQFMGVELKSNEHCSEFYTHVNKLPLGLAESQYCVTNSNITDASTCKGFIGGPLLAQNERDGFYLIGIANFVKQCYSTVYPIVYTKLSAYQKWLETIIY